MSNLHLIAYISEAAVPNEHMSDEIAAITAWSKLVNPDYDITGVLLYGQRMFMQVIEGPKDRLTMLMEKITKDSRHTNIEILLDEPVQQRGFDTWSVECFNARNSTMLDHEKLKEICVDYKTNLVPGADSLVKFCQLALE